MFPHEDPLTSETDDENDPEEPPSNEESADGLDYWELDVLDDEFEFSFTNAGVVSTA